MNPVLSPANRKVYRSEYLETQNGRLRVIGLKDWLVGGLLTHGVRWPHGGLFRDKIQGLQGHSGSDNITIP